MESNPETGSPLLLVTRGILGGALMGLANLVPGVSGGTMLLAAGVYPAFISGIAELTMLRFRPRSLLLLGSIVGSAGLAILLFAGAIKTLVVDHRWAMYSLFVGLTLGGIPLVWRMARPPNTSVLMGALVAFAVMVAMAFFGAATGGEDGRNYLLIFAAGVAASSAMILPGVSGGYLLLLLGQYEAILGTIEQLKTGLLGGVGQSGPDVALLLDALHVVTPLALGIVTGVVGVSNLLRWLLARFEKATLGALLGLLLGAVVGLWPFQQGEPPEIGERIKSRVVTAENIADFDPEDWTVRSFHPSTGQALGGVGLIALGLGATLLIGRLGSPSDPPI